MARDRADSAYGAGWADMSRGRITPTLAICVAAGLDAGNRQMQAAGRARWNEDDYNRAAKTQNDLRRKYLFGPNHDQEKDPG